MVSQLAVEPLRASADFASLGLAWLPLMLAARGRGETVLILPGWRASDSSTLLLRTYLNALGYRALPWELGANRGLTAMWSRLLQRFDAIVETRPTDTRLSLIGWSLGGVLAQVLGRVIPSRIERVITLGSPLLPTPIAIATAANLRGAAQVGWPWRPSAALRARAWNASSWLDSPPPLTAVYSRSDAIVPAAVAMGDYGVHDRVEVAASHFGLGFSAAVFNLIADRLAADPRSRFAPNPFWRPFYASRESQSVANA